jgi:S-adenosylmethionine:tRNA ribosyltransferase-isomerase
VSTASPRLVRVAFHGDAAAMWRSIYEGGRPVQYSYVEAPLELWHVQSPFASRPWAVESPSAGRPLTFALRERLRRGARPRRPEEEERWREGPRARGAVGVVPLTHAAGLSSTGDPALDALLPLDERYDLPASTVEAMAQTRAEGGRVIAVGTTVVRALEGCAEAHGGELVAGEGSTRLRLDGRSKLCVASGLLTGMHERTTTHFELMQSFVPRDLLDRATEHPERAGYLQHEFGDSVLILAR